jgi:FAD-dependent urate hydroxylase
MRAIVVGGGIGGLAAAVALRRAGVEAVVFEKAGELREIGAGISLWANAMKALQKLGLYEAVLALGKPLRPKGELRSPNGEVFYEMPAAAMEERFGDVTAVVHRADLQKTLHAALGEEAIRLGVEFTGFEQDKGGVVARFAGGREERCDLLIGADGLHSVVRRQLLDDGPPLYAGYVAWRGVAELGDEPFPGGGRSRRGAGASGLGWSSSGGGRCTGTPQRTRRRGKKTRVPDRDVKRNCSHASEVGTGRSLQS